MGLLSFLIILFLGLNVWLWMPSISISSILFKSLSSTSTSQEIIEKQPPILTLKDFIHYKKREADLDDPKWEKEEDNLDNLLLDGMDHYTGMACIKSINVSSIEEAKYTLYQQLKTVPEHIRQDVVDSALIERTSILNVVHNSSKPLQSNGRASAYLGWWSTRFTAPATYETCALVAGITFTAAEVIAGYVEERKTERIGFQPCHCGFWSCQQCPIFVEKTYSILIYKRHAFTAQEHKKLHTYMIKEAMDLASKTLSGGAASQAISDEEWGQQDGWLLHPMKQEL